MSKQTDQLKLLASALQLSRADIADIIALGGIVVSKNRVDTWLRGKNSTKNASGNSEMVGKRIGRSGDVSPDEFHAFCVGLKPWLDRLEGKE